MRRSCPVAVLAGFALILLTAPAAADSPPFFLAIWGSLGTAPGQFNHPFGVATDGHGHVYVADQNNHRVEKFDLDGTFVLEFPTGEITFPSGITVGPNDQLYVVMNHTHVVHIDSSTGDSLGRIGGPGFDPGQFYYPVAVTTDPVGNVYVADYGNRRVDKFTAGGSYLFSWSTEGGPYGIGADAAGNVYVGEWESNEVEKFDSNGGLITRWGSYGTGSGQFYGTEGTAVDGAGSVYVCDTGNNRVQKFTSSGAYLTQWGGLGSGPGQFYTPSDIAIDEFGDLYVADWNNSRIQKFSVSAPVPTSAMTWGRLKASYR